MPSRHISHQSFDDILSELGDDPAIPDPHGIRKSSSPPMPKPEAHTQSKQVPISYDKSNLQILKLAPIFILGGIFFLVAGALFIAFESHKESSKLEIDGLQDQIAALKKELTFIQDNWIQDQEDVYAVIDELEVSIHSINTRPSTQHPQNRPAAIAHEAELRRWRYLGLIKMNGAEQAFFHNGKTAEMVAKDGLALGEWRLIKAQKEVATLAHPKGKLINFMSAKSE